MPLTDHHHHHYLNTKSTTTTYSNYPSHCSNDLSIPYTPISHMRASSKHSWPDYVPDSREKMIKDEVIDCDLLETPSVQNNHIDYTIFDSEIDPLNRRNPHSIQPPPSSSIQKTDAIAKTSDSLTSSGNSLTNFNHRTTSSPNQNSTIVKQQPFSPPPYHPLTNGFFSHLHHPHQRATPSPDHEQISPLSTNLTETSSTSNLVPPTNTGGGTSSPDDKRRCAVCNDIASGYHYGVWSCEGCKAFFKRSIQGTNEYICPATNTCTIDKHRRKSCQACRLRKCYEVGMTKGTTRRERKYRKKAVSVCKITSTSSNPNNNNNNNNNININSGHPLPLLNTLTPPTTGTPSTQIHPNTNNPFSSPQLSINKATSDIPRIPITPADFIATLSQASRLSLPAKIDPSRSLDDQYFLQLLAKIFDQELVVLINWAKAMPGYTESLTLDQQVTIIEQSWLDTLLLNIIERSIERNDDALHFAPDFIITHNRDLSSPCLGSICQNLFNILQAFKDPRTTHEEFIALKATILINSIPSTIGTTKSFRMLTNQVYQAVQYTCDSNPSVYHDNYIRQFTLLLQLPHIKMLSSKLIKLFLDMRTNDLLPQADLLLEMLDAQDTFDVNSSFVVGNPTNYSSTKSYSQQDENKNQNTENINDQITYSGTYASSTNKRSPPTPPVQMYKHQRTDSAANLHFPMNHSSY